MKLSKHILLLLCDIYEIGPGYYELKYPKDKDVRLTINDYCQHDEHKKIYPKSYSRQKVANYADIKPKPANFYFKSYHKNGWRVFKKKDI